MKTNQEISLKKMTIIKPNLWNIIIIIAFALGIYQLSIDDLSFIEVILIMLSGLVTSVLVYYQARKEMTIGVASIMAITPIYFAIIMMILFFLTR